MNHPGLTPEPETDPDAKFRNWMRLNLARAAEEFDLTVTGNPVFGWRLRSVGARAEGPAGPRWLRVASSEVEWARGPAWTGNVDANSFDGIPKPTVLASTEWTEWDWRTQRAEVMPLLNGLPCSPTDVLHRDVNLANAWWANLHRSVDRLAATPTERVHADQDKIDARLRKAFGDHVVIQVEQWETVHGDLHWANLLSPELVILDWESWGRGPVGTDAATLYCYSLLIPSAARTVHEVFADVLDTPAGRVAQLCVGARLLNRAAQGDHPELVKPLTHHLDELLSR
ncbi:MULTISPECIES: phosphotransferase [unclassified Crossiella]|uniref:phosphotransferase n=1 Tax=unclassified Crossiella TaxID=2620835 RepID=UPI0020000FF9|nr:MULTISPECIES: aminoglycoside phosphotransferase [unclassified Crossiella]MCK2241882.1 aminoglycoside phosphotransferase [Crossiella sp. S99.2]MCK2255785.1 aminoglycoside phosphotransferase [Crossiella sp. S99.1]